YLGNADLLSSSLGGAREARAQVRGVRRSLRESHHAADGSTASRSRYLCRAVLRDRLRQGRPGRDRADRTGGEERAGDGAKGTQYHEGRATPRSEDRQPGGFFDG